LGVDSNNGDCFIIPVEDIKNWKDTVDFKHLAKYKENWDIFKKLAKD
jgi:hypothetical protein